jgi:hypothetical protein
MEKTGEDLEDDQGQMLGSLFLEKMGLIKKKKTFRKNQKSVSGFVTIGNYRIWEDISERLGRYEINISCDPNGDSDGAYKQMLELYNELTKVTFPEADRCRSNPLVHTEKVFYDLLSKHKDTPAGYNKEILAVNKNFQNDILKIKA